MATIDTSGLDEMIRAMERLGQNTEAVASVMLEAGAQEIKSCWKESAEEHGHRDTGAMIDSIAVAKGASGARFRDIYPQGKDKKGVRNAEKAFILHYGRNGAREIKASYWVDDAEAEGNIRVEQKLNGLWGQYLETGQVPAIPAAGDSAGGITKTTK